MPTSRLSTALRFLLQAPRSESERAALLAAIALALFWFLDNAQYNFIDPWSIVAIAACVLAATRAMRSLPGASLLALAVALAAGFANRIGRAPWDGSDVLTATREALDTIASGQNPYLHYFVSTSPPGAPFPYLPGELLFYAVPYALTHSILTVDRLAGFLTLVLLATLVPIAGFARTALLTALLATFALAGIRSVDGSNDTSLAFLLVACIVALAWAAYARGRKHPRAATALVSTSAVLLAWALLFKALAWPFAPFLIAYVCTFERASARWFVVIVGAIVGVTLDAAILFAPTGFVSNVLGGFSFHNDLSGLTIWAALRTAGVTIQPLLPVIPIVDVVAVACVFAVCIVRRVGSLGDAVLRGVLVLATLLMFARWASSTYYAYACALLVAGLALLPTSVTNTKAAS